MFGDWDFGLIIFMFVLELEVVVFVIFFDMQGCYDIKIVLYYFVIYRINYLFWWFNFQVGDSFVVVDCGGGMVDFISYDMVSFFLVMVKECVKGQGM